MAWNEPGNDKKPNDPWGNRGSNQGPPDLDEIIRNFQKKFGGLFGGGRRTSSTGGRNFSFGLIIVVIAVIWLATGFYKIEEAERGIIMQFGRYHDTTLSGLHWHIPRPIQKVVKVDVSNVSTLSVNATMLTQDENIVDVEASVQYRIGNPTDYLFKVSNPEKTLVEASESALRESIGKSKMDFIITEGRAHIATDVQTLTQEILDQYKTGLLITKVNIRQAKPPEAVKEAFDDVNKAREDEVRFKNEADAYRNEVIPRARGASARIREEADGYKQEVVARAEGEADRFTKLLKEYKRAPGVTRDRLYIDAVESVLGNSSKIMIDVEGGNNLLYLPLDKLIGTAGGSQQITDVLEGLSSRERTDTNITRDTRTRFNSRSRETR